MEIMSLEKDVAYISTSICLEPRPLLAAVFHRLLDAPPGRIERP
jgi:hypothetical protein